MAAASHSAAAAEKPARLPPRGRGQGKSGQCCHDRRAAQQEKQAEARSLGDWQEMQPHHQRHRRQQEIGAVQVHHDVARQEQARPSPMLLHMMAFSTSRTGLILCPAGG
jgi:hypothetical protein